MQRPNRREILAGSLATLGLASGGLLDSAWAALPDTSPLEPLARGEFLGLVPFDKPAKVGYGQLAGEGLFARRMLDLSTLNDSTRVTPTDRHFVRTGVPAMLPDLDSWRLGVRTRVGPPQELSLTDLRALATPMGVHLCESAANDATVGFGMISAAAWSGVPLTGLLERFGRPETPFRVLVDGFDRHLSDQPDKRAGASWIFSPEELASSGAFIALAMNDKPLPPEHGAPLRLVVPGWYGCSWIKWVHTVAVVAEDSFTTPHMREFARRTHQAGIPKRAARFAPAVVDAAAMPIRLEKWRVGGKVELRLVGVRWGGGEPGDAVSLRFGPEEAFKPVTSFVPPENLHGWSFWSHRWRPVSPGIYGIELMVGKSRIRTRRLSAGHYLRQVTLQRVET